MESVDLIGTLDAEEVAALRAAAAWYASYFRDEIAAEAGSGSSYAVVERERYLALCRALRKLGMRFALPEPLARAATTEHAA